MGPECSLANTHTHTRRDLERVQRMLCRKAFRRSRCTQNYRGKLCSNTRECEALDHSDMWKCFKNALSEGNGAQLPQPNFLLWFVSPGNKNTTHPACWHRMKPPYACSTRRDYSNATRALDLLLFSSTVCSSYVSLRMCVLDTLTSSHMFTCTYFTVIWSIYINMILCILSINVIMPLMACWKMFICTVIPNVFQFSLPVLFMFKSKIYF